MNIDNDVSKDSNILIKKEDEFTWLITGVAGFIGSNLLERLLKLNQRVVGLDNFSTGKQHNLEEVRGRVSPREWMNFKMIEGDIRSLDHCREAMSSVDFVLHHAASSSVAKSIQFPLATNANNVDGFLNILVAGRDAAVRRIIYASSSAIYGNQSDLSLDENKFGQMQSPYAVTKRINELYAEIYHSIYDTKVIGLRYFNIYGPRQDQYGDYAAVIPAWINAMINDEPVYINGDGETSRDFCYVDDVVQANLAAAMTNNSIVENQIYNIAGGTSISLNYLFECIKCVLVEYYPRLSSLQPIYRDFRQGDIRHSRADISQAKALLKYEPKYLINSGLINTINWYVRKLAINPVLLESLE